jgi:hypothetical protein
MTRPRCIYTCAWITGSISVLVIAALGFLAAAHALSLTLTYEPHKIVVQCAGCH